MKTKKYFIDIKKLFLLLSLSFFLGSINVNAQLQEAFVDTSYSKGASPKKGDLQEAFVPSKKPTPPSTPKPAPVVVNKAPVPVVTKEVAPVVTKEVVPVVVKKEVVPVVTKEVVTVVKVEPSTKSVVVNSESAPVVVKKEVVPVIKAESKPVVVKAAPLQKTIIKSNKPASAPKKTATTPAKKKSIASAKENPTTKTITSTFAPIEKKDDSYSWWQILFFLYWGLGCVAIVIHTPIVLFFTNKIKSFASGVDFYQERQKKGLGDSTLEETQKCYAILEEGFADWGYLKDALVPSNSSAFKNGFKALRQVEKMMPTDEALRTEMANKASAFSNASERVFGGSWLALGLGCFFLFVSHFSLFMIISLILYVVASLSPKYLVYLRGTRRGAHTGTSGAIAIAGADFMAGKFTRTTTTWSDGSKTVEDDHSDTWISLALVIIIAAVVGMFISFFAVFNYLRNYVFYF